MLLKLRSENIILGVPSSQVWETLTDSRVIWKYTHWKTWGLIKIVLRVLFPLILLGGSLPGVGSLPHTPCTDQSSAKDSRVFSLGSALLSGILPCVLAIFTYQPHQLNPGRWSDSIWHPIPYAVVWQLSPESIINWAHLIHLPFLRSPCPCFLIPMSQSHCLICFILFLTFFFFFKCRKVNPVPIPSSWLYSHI